MVGASDSSSKDDDEPPTDEATDEARDKVAFKLTKEILADPLTATALVQALKKLGFEFPVGQGVTKKCGVDFIKVEIPEAARVRKLKIKDKEKGNGKKSKNSNKAQSTPGNDNAQDPEVLDIKISKSESENLYVENNNESKAGPSDRVAKWQAK